MQYKTCSKIISVLTRALAVFSVHLWPKGEVLEVPVAFSLGSDTEDFRTGPCGMFLGETQAEANRNKMCCFSSANTS